MCGWRVCDGKTLSCYGLSREEQEEAETRDRGGPAEGAVPGDCFVHRDWALVFTVTLQVPVVLSLLGEGVMTRWVHLKEGEPRERL